MTLIAVTPEGIYYDSRATVSCVVSDINKLYVMDDGMSLLFSGSTVRGAMVTKQYNDKAVIDPGNDFCGVFYDKSTRMYRLLDGFNGATPTLFDDIEQAPIESLTVFGSGSNLFWMFYSLTDSYRQAALKAFKYDTGCGGTLRLLKPDGEVEKCS